MTPRKGSLLFAAMLLVQPPPAADARVLMVPSCGGAPSRQIIPGDPAAPAPQDGCTKACHAVTERRGKSTSAKRDCC